MMTNIRLYRAKRIDNGEWVVGYYHNIQESDGKNSHYILDGTSNTRHIMSVTQTIFQVDPLTLGQSTGLFDKNGKEMLEGDQVQLSINDEEPRHHGVVEYLAPKFFVMDGDKSGLILTDRYEIIGNIHDHD